MTLLLSFVFLGFVLEDDNLLFLALSNYLASHFDFFNFFAYLNALVVSSQDDGERYSRADACVQLFNLYKIAFSNLILLASVFENSVHDDTSSNQSRRIQIARWLRQRKIARFKKPVPSGSVLNLA